MLVATIALLILCVLGAGLTYAYVRWRFGQIARVACADCAGGGRDQPMTVLVVGSDSRANISPAEAKSFCERPDCSDQAGPDHSDTIILMHADPRQHKATVLSIPRDLNVPIADTGRRDRINTAFSTSINTLVRTLKANFGIAVDHFVIVDFVGFRGIVGALSGIQVYFPSPARDRVSGLNVPQAGCVRLDGNNALGYVRSRHYEYFEAGRWHNDPYSDLSRIQRQQDFIRRVMRRALSVRNPLTANALIGTAVHSVKIDDKFSRGDILRLGQRFRSLSPDAVDMLTLPTDPIKVGAADELKAHEPDAALTIGRFLQQASGTSTGGAARSVLPNSVRVRVLNGSGQKGQATAAATKLQEGGLALAGTGDADAFNYQSSVVRYGTGQLAKAQYVQSIVQGPSRLQPDATLRGVDIVLVTGARFVGIQPSGTGPSAIAGAVPTTTVPPNGPTATPGGPPLNRGAPTHPQC